MLCDVFAALGFEESGEVAREDYVGEGEGPAEEGCYLCGGEAGYTTAYAGDVECQFGMLSGKFNEGVDVGTDGIDAALHGGDGIGVALEAFAPAPDGSEAFVGYAGCAAGVCAGKVAAEHEYVVRA